MPEFDENEIEFDEANASPAMRKLRDALKRAEKDAKQWRQAAEEAKESTAQVEALRKETAMLRAGVPDTKVGKMFAQSYNGEATPEAIKAAWAELASELASNTPPPSEQQDDDRRRLRDEMAAADDLSRNMAGNLSPDREAAYEAERLAAKSPDELVAVLDKYGKLARQD